MIFGQSEVRPCLTSWYNVLAVLFYCLKVLNPTGLRPSIPSPFAYPLPRWSLRFSVSFARHRDDAVGANTQLWRDKADRLEAASEHWATDRTASRRPVCAASWGHQGAEFADFDRR